MFDLVVKRQYRLHRVFLETSESLPQRTPTRLVSPGGKLRRELLGMRGHATDIGARAVVAIRARFRGAPKSKVGTATDASSMGVLWPIEVTKHRRGKSTAGRITQRVDHERSLGQIRSVRCESPQPAFFGHLPWESDASTAPPSWVESYRQQRSHVRDPRKRVASSGRSFHEP